MKRLLTLAMAVAMLMGVVACSDGSCYDNANSLPLVRFYASGGGKVTVNGVTLRGIDAPGDSAYIKNVSREEVYLPLRATKNSTQWIISVTTTTGASVADTLSINYSSQPYFASAECGAMFNFELKRVDCTHNFIDSVVVMQPVVTNVSQETMRIYLKQ